MSSELNNLSCEKKECKQIDVYILTQSLSLLINGSFLLAVLIETNTKVTVNKIAVFIGLIIILIVLAILLYYLIKYLCKNGYNVIAWILALAPFFTAPFTTYNNVSIIIDKCTSDD
jgi:glucan phosphoethanolaminetransferase (alkaline phosphatase superfamily)